MGAISSETKKIRLVVFDWAGTTVDFGSCAPAASFTKAFAAHGVEVSAAQAREPMGLSKRVHLATMLGMPDIATRWKAIHDREWTETDVDTMYKEFVPIQLKAIDEHADLVPGLLDVVSQLRARELKIGGSTGYFREAAVAVAKSAAEAGFEPDDNVCADDVPQGRPAPWMIYRLMEKLGVCPASSVVKVGDTIADVQAGLHAGCWAVGVCDSSSLMGLSLPEYRELTEDRRADLLVRTTEAFRQAGCHAVVESIQQLPGAIDELSERLRNGERP